MSIPYLNFHRPCGFAQLIIGKRGRHKRLYRQQDYATPYEKLCSLVNWESHLKEGLTAAQLAQRAMADSDTKFARQMQKAKQQLLSRVRREERMQTA